MLFGEVTTLAEPEIFLGIKPQNLGEKFLYLGFNAFLRPVVQNYDLRIYTLARITDGL